MPDLALTELGNWNSKVRGPFSVKKMPETASQTFKKGDWLLVEAASTVSIAAAAGSQHENANEVLYGIALEDASGTTNNEISCLVFEEGTEILVPIYHTTAASAVFAQTDIGNVHPMINESTGGWMVDKTDATNPCVQIVEMGESYAGNEMAVGDQYGAVWVRIIRADRAMGVDAVYPT